jgi:SAM-dependent methyltransferase
MNNPFDACSSEYNRFRPDYPPELYDYLIQSRPSRVLDVGAGTGKGAIPLLKRGVNVMCAEPSMEMAREGRASNPSLVYVRSHAEALPFRGETFDLVTAAQCFHWFRPDTALPELARVLKPKGRFAVFWNNRNQSLPHTLEFERLINQFNPKYNREYRKKDWGAIISSTGDFAIIDAIEFRIVRPMTLDDWVGLSRSIAYVRAIGDDKMIEFEKALRDALQGFESIDLHYVTECWLASKSVR